MAFEYLLLVLGGVDHWFIWNDQIGCGIESVIGSINAGQDI